MKKFLEKELGWKTLQAKTAGHSVLYLMRDATDKHTVMFEFKASGSVGITYGGETRIIPDPKSVVKALGLPDNLPEEEQISVQRRVLDQALDKLIRKHREETQAMVEDMMERFGRGKL